MNEYRIKWQQRPYIQTLPQVMFVEANTVEEAQLVAKDHIERSYGIASYGIDSVELYTRPPGRVLGGSV